MPKLSEFLFGKKGKSKKLSTLTPEQEQLMSLITQGLSKGEGSLSSLFGGFNEQAFKEGVSDPAIKQFKEEILPLLQEKFIGNNQALSSGFQRAQLKAGTDLQSKLAQLMYQAQQDQQKNQLSGIQTSLGTTGFENIYKPGKTGALQAFSQGAGQSLGSTFGGAIAG